MKYIKNFNESISNNEIENFLDSNRIENYRINDDQTIDVIGDATIRLNSIPNGIKFGHIGNIFKITVNTNNYHFFPDSAKKWKIEFPLNKSQSESKFWTKYKNIVKWEETRYSDFMAKYGIDSGKDKMLSDYYIEMSSNGGLLRQYSDDLEDLIWEDTKGEFFSNTEIKIEDYPPFASYNDVDFNQVIENAKSEKFENACDLIIGIILNDDGFYKSKFESIYLGSIYDKIKSTLTYDGIFNNANKLREFRSIINMNLQKTPETVKRDKEEDCYVFIARKDFIENEDGTYTKTISVENMVNIDIYDPKSYQTINMMRLRTRFNTDTDLYMIWLPKDFFHSDKNKIPNEYQLKIIDKYKKKI